MLRSEALLGAKTALHAAVQGTAQPQSVNKETHQAVTSGVQPLHCLEVQVTGHRCEEEDSVQQAVCGAALQEAEQKSFEKCACCEEAAKGYEVATGVQRQAPNKRLAHTTARLALVIC